MMRRRFALGTFLAGMVVATAAADFDDLSFYVWFAPGFNASSRACHQLEWLSKGGSARLIVPTLDSGTLCDALVRAHDSGADVRVLMPRSGVRARGSLVAVLVGAKVPILIDDQHAGPAPRYLVVGRDRVFTGAFGNDKPEQGWGDASDIRCPDYADQYRRDWDRHAAHAAPWPEPKRP